MSLEAFSVFRYLVKQKEGSSVLLSPPNSSKKVKGRSVMCAIPFSFICINKVCSHLKSSNLNHTV